jgi:hypothetical protein
MSTADLPETLTFGRGGLPVLLWQIQAASGAHQIKPAQTARSFDESVLQLYGVVQIRTNTNIKISPNDWNIFMIIHSQPARQAGFRPKWRPISFSIA